MKTLVSSLFRRIFIVSLVLLSLSGGSAISGHETVEPGRIVFHNGETTPRFATLLPNSLQVPAGNTTTLSGDVTYDAIEVSGTLRIAAGSKVRFIHLMILPGGYLEVGTGSSPICQLTELIIRNVPLDLTRDPWQWGNGIINFGTQSRVGCTKVTHTELAVDAPQGASSVTVANVSGWLVGDELVFADMRPQAATTPVRDSKTVITGISGNVVTIAPGLGFARESVRDQDGGQVARPRVMNLTRSIVIRSEDPNGTRGHTANIGGASWDVRYNEFVGVGRTTFADLSNTTSDGTPGGNQVGKYADHAHHAGSSLAVRQSIGNSYQGTFGSKWANVVHGTHDTLIEDNVCVDFQGGCFVTEDGYEVRNVFRGNVASYSIGNNRQAHTNVNSPNNCPGCEGSGFWPRAVANVFENNESWNNVKGFTLFNIAHVDKATPVPSVKGGTPDTVLNVTASVPIAFVGNVSIGNSTVGAELWATHAFQNVNLISVHNGTRQLWATNSGNNMVYLTNPSIICGSTRADGLVTAPGYTTTVDIEGGFIRGCEQGTQAATTVRMKNVTLQNLRNFTGRPTTSTFESVLHLQLGGAPKNFFDFEMDSVWQGGALPDTSQGILWTRQRGSEHTVIDHNRTGQDFKLFVAQQRGSTLAWPALDKGHGLFVPENGITMLEAWQKYGVAYMGEAIADSDIIQVEGIGTMLARAGRTSQMGAPGVTLTYPNPITPLPAGIASVELLMVMVGDGSQANETAVLSIDGGTPIRRSTVTGRPDQRKYVTSAVAPGWHTVVTWREGSTGAKIAASERTFCYPVGENAGDKPASCGTGGGGGTDPNPPGPEVCGDGIDNDGDGQIDEGCAPPPPPPDPCVVSPLVPSVSVTAAGHTVTWTGAITVTDERGCSAVVSQ